MTENISAAHRAERPGNAVRALARTGVLAALTCGATLAVRVASPTGGYLNLGDAAVLLGAWLLGPWYGAAAAGVGSMLADVLAGAAMYAPATLVVKAVMALTAGGLYRRLGRFRGGLLFCGAAGEVPMLAGYWLYDALLLRSFSGAAAGVPGNLVQALFGMAAAAALAGALRKSAYVRRSFPGL